MLSSNNKLATTKDKTFLRGLWSELRGFPEKKRKKNVGSYAATEIRTPPQRGEITFSLTVPPRAPHLQPSLLWAN